MGKYKKSKIRSDDSTDFDTEATWGEQQHRSHNKKRRTRINRYVGMEDTKNIRLNSQQMVQH